MLSGIAKYYQLLAKVATGVTTAAKPSEPGPYDLTLSQGRVQGGMINFADDEDFYDSILTDGPFLKIVFPTTTSNENLTARNAQKLYQIKAELYVSLLKPTGNNFLLDPDDFTEEAWINNDGNIATTHRLTDPSNTQVTSICQVLEVPNDTSPYLFSVIFRKSAVATVFPAIQLSFQGDTCATPTYSTAAINTNTGEAQIIDGEATSVVVSVDEVTDFWKLNLTVENNGLGNDQLVAGILPAACGTDFVLDVSLVGFVDCFSPVLTQSDVVSHNIVDYSYILQLLSNLNDAWLDSENFIDCGRQYPGVDNFSSGDLFAPVDVKPNVGLIEITLSHRSIC